MFSIMNYKKISDGLTFLMSDKRITIVHGVLKSLGISPRRDDYDDFVQDASIIFAQAYADFLQEKDEVENERDLMVLCLPTDAVAFAGPVTAATT